MPSRRSVLAGIGGASALVIPGCSALSSGSDGPPGASHLANAIETSLHPEQSRAPDGYDVSYSSVDHSAIRSALDGTEIDPGDANVIVYDGFDHVSEVVSVTAVQLWEDAAPVAGEYSVWDGEFDADAITPEWDLPSSPDDTYRGYDRYESGTLDGPSSPLVQIGFTDDTWIGVHTYTAGLPPGAGDPYDTDEEYLWDFDDAVDVLTPAIDAEHADDQFDHWALEPLSIVGTDYYAWLSFGELESSSPDVATANGWEIDGSTVDNTLAFGLPDVESFEEFWDDDRAETVIDQYRLQEEDPEVDVRDRTAVLTWERTLEEQFG